MQFGFIPDAILNMQPVQERYQARKKRLYYALVDLEKAFEYRGRLGEMGFEEAGCG